MAGGAAGGEEIRQDIGALLRQVLELPEGALRLVVPGLLPAVSDLVERNPDILRADSWASASHAGDGAGNGALPASGGGGPGGGRGDSSLIEAVLSFMDKSVELSLLPLPHIPAHADLDERRRKEKMRAARSESATYTHTRVLEVLVLLLLLSPQSLRLRHYKAGLRLLSTLAHGSADLGICCRALDHLYAMQKMISKKAVSCGASAASSLATSSSGVADATPPASALTEPSTTTSATASELSATPPPAAPAVSVDSVGSAPAVDAALAAFPSNHGPHSSSPDASALAPDTQAGVVGRLGGASERGAGHKDGRGSGGGIFSKIFGWGAGAGSAGDDDAHQEPDRAMEACARALCTGPPQDAAVLAAARAPGSHLEPGGAASSSQPLDALFGGNVSCTEGGSVRDPGHEPGAAAADLARPACKLPTTRHNNGAGPAGGGGGGGVGVGGGEGLDVAEAGPAAARLCGKEGRGWEMGVEEGGRLWELWALVVSAMFQACSGMIGCAASLLASRGVTWRHGDRQQGQSLSLPHFPSVPLSKC
jgi:hypothetical protein